MGTAALNGNYRADNKSYRLLTPQVPLVRTKEYSEWGMDSHPSGTNAVVAVLSYTGYDMEDAMIINRASYDRGFGHGCVYKTATRKLTGRYTLIDTEHRRKAMEGVIKGNTLDSDGLPRVGAVLTAGLAELCVWDEIKGKPMVYLHRDKEDAVVEAVKISQADTEEP